MLSSSAAHHVLHRVGKGCVAAARRIGACATGCCWRTGTSTLLDFGDPHEPKSIGANLFERDVADRLMSRSARVSGFSLALGYMASDHVTLQSARSSSVLSMTICTVIWSAKDRAGAPSSDAPNKMRTRTYEPHPRCLSESQCGTDCVWCGLPLRRFNYCYCYGCHWW
jgi:hypothetical protein